MDEPTRLTRYDDRLGGYRWKFTLSERDFAAMSQRQLDDLHAGLALLSACMRPDAAFGELDEDDLLGRIALVSIEDAASRRLPLREHAVKGQR